MFITLCFVCLIALQDSKAQLRLAAGADVLSNVSSGFFNNIPKFRVGLEAQYFLVSSFAITGGLESWTDGPNVLGTVGGRFYPINPVFIRVRGVLANNADFALGGGYAIRLSKNWRLEFMGDYYAVSRGLGVRIGTAVKL